MWVITAAVFLFVEKLLFCMCRAAADADKRMEEMFRRKEDKEG